MRVALYFLTLGILVYSLPAYGQGSSYSYTRVESSSSSNSNTNSSTNSSQETVFTEKPSIKFNPKFKERINNLKDQVSLSLAKGFITKEESDSFNVRINQLSTQEADLEKKGYPKAELDDLEKNITLANGDLYKASNKPTVPTSPAKSDTAPGAASDSAEKKVETPAPSGNSDKKAASSVKTTSTVSTAKKPSPKTPVKSTKSPAKPSSKH